MENVLANLNSTQVEVNEDDSLVMFSNINENRVKRTLYLRNMKEMCILRDLSWQVGMNNQKYYRFQAEDMAHNHFWYNLIYKNLVERKRLRDAANGIKIGRLPIKEIPSEFLYLNKSSNYLSLFLLIS